MKARYNSVYSGQAMRKSGGGYLFVQMCVHCGVVPYVYLYFSFTVSGGQMRLDEVPVCEEKSVTDGMNKYVKSHTVSDTEDLISEQCEIRLC